MKINFGTGSQFSSDKQQKGYYAYKATNKINGSGKLLADEIPVTFEQAMEIAYKQRLMIDSVR